MFANNITVQWQLTPKLYAFKSATPAALLSINDSRFEQQHFSFDWSSGTVSCTFANSADVEGVRYSLSFAASASSNEQFYATTDHEWDFQVTTEPHLRAYNYPESVYTYSSFIFYFGYLVLALGLLSCLAGLFSPTRLAGLEAVFVLQYAFISLLWFSSYLYLPYYCLSPLQFSPGYHYPLAEASETENPPQAQTFGVVPESLLSNFNVNCLFYVVPLVSMAVAAVVYWCTSDAEKKVDAAGRLEFCVEMFFYGSMFNVSFLVCCACMFYSAGSPAEVPAHAITGFGIVSLILCLVAFGVAPYYFRRFRYAFRIGCLTFSQYYFYCAYLIAGVVLLALLPSLPWLPFLPQGLMLVYLCVLRPYKLASENIRAIFNVLAMNAITGMRVFWEFSDASSRRSSSAYVFPGVIQLLLFLVVVWATISTLLDFLEEYYFKKKRQK